MFSPLSIRVYVGCVAYPRPFIDPVSYLESSYRTLPDIASQNFKIWEPPRFIFKNFDSDPKTMVNLTKPGRPKKPGPGRVCLLPASWS